MANHPAPIISNQLALVTQRLVHSTVGHTAEVTYAVVPDTTSTAQNVADTVQTVFNARLPALLDSNVTIEQPYVVLGDGTNVPTVALGGLSPTVGSSAQTSPPPQVATLIKKITNLGGKRNRGRMYLPWCLHTSDVSESGLIDGTQLAAIQTMVGHILSDLVADGKPMVIANKTLALDPDTHKPYVTHISAGPEVITLLAEPSVATQRRRLPRVG